MRQCGTGYRSVFWIMSTYFSQTSPQGVLGNKLHPFKAGALAYLHNDIEMGTQAL